MPDGKPITPVPEGKETNPPVENPDQPISLYDKTEAIVTRQEEANKKAEEILDRQEKLHANQRLAGTGGGHVDTTPAKEETPKEYRDRIDKEISEGKHGD